ncbi:MAG: DUF3034 family protein [Sphingomonas fennica]
MVTPVWQGADMERGAGRRGRVVRMVAAGAALIAAADAASAARERRAGGKLLLTYAASALEGSSGGGLAPWATIAGNETRDGIGAQAHASAVFVRDYAYRSGGAAIGLFDRIELSYARQRLDTRAIGAALGLGRGYAFRQDVYGAKLKLFGDLVYGDPLLPAVAVGVQHKRNRNGAVVRAIGAGSDRGTDYYVSATRLLLARSVLLNATARLSKANQIGLLGFGGDRGGGYRVRLEGSAGYQVSRRLLVGAEYRAKPDRLSIAREDDWIDLFAAYALSRNLTATVAYVDLGSIATADGQRGMFLQLQAGF